MTVKSHRWEHWLEPNPAEMLNITVGTSKWHLANARKELQRLIRQQDQDELVVRGY